MATTKADAEHIFIPNIRMRVESGIVHLKCYSCDGDCQIVFGRTIKAGEATKYFCSSPCLRNYVTRKVLHDNSSSKVENAKKNADEKKSKNEADSTLGRRKLIERKLGKDRPPTPHPAVENPRAHR